MWRTKEFIRDFETVEDMSTKKNGKQFADEVPDFENELPACSDHPLFNAQIDQIFSCEFLS